jgi:hypothetical protein
VRSLRALLRFDSPLRPASPGSTTPDAFRAAREQLPPLANALVTWPLGDEPRQVELAAAKVLPAIV